jgi:hypothetical protein
MRQVANHGPLRREPLRNTIMGYLGKLVVREVPQADAFSKVAGLLKPPQEITSDVVRAGAHSISYEY